MYKTLKTLIISAAMAVTAMSVVPQTAAAQDLTKIRVGYIPVGVYSYLWRARDAGYFEDAGLEVELVTMAGGGEIIPALQSGSLQFGISDALGVLNARNAGIPATYVSFNFAQTEESPVHAALTFDPEITGPADLAGKSVATNLSFNTDWTMMRAWMRNAGVDLDTVQFQEIPFPEMLASARSGAVTVVGAVEPFVTLAKAGGATVLGHFFTEVKSPVVLSGVVAMMPWIEENQDLTVAFVEAIDKAITDFNGDPQIARDTIDANTKIPPEVVQTMELGVWDTDVDPNEMQFWVDAASVEGMLGAETDLEDLVWTPSK
ncbi:ABC transporter substrate-binding protein [Martelella soudanensis]|uniref:ABC transporter substrate-binding protein n=1 Tax=unclassified Martelella TaxID=2629616 RepID=UPI001FEE0711|nr:MULTISPECIES: ABC transporter substrate-binding protein [unclassified Martelella]